MRKSHGLRVRSRSRLTKRARARGLPSTNKFMATFNVGDKVVINIEPSIQNGQPYTRFDGKTGEIIRQQGSSYVLRVSEGNAKKEVISLPVHLTKIGG